MTRAAIEKCIMIYILLHLLVFAVFCVKVFLMFS